MHFGEMVELEGQVVGTYYHTLQEYIGLALDLTVTDMMKLHTCRGALVRATRFSATSGDIMYEHCSDRRSMSADRADSACQCSLAESVDILSMTDPQVSRTKCLTIIFKLINEFIFLFLDHKMF